MDNTLVSSILNLAHEGVILSDADNKVIKANDLFLEMSGYGPEDFLGQGVSDLFAEDNDADKLQVYKDLLVEKGSWTGHLYLHNKGGDVSQYEVSSKGLSEEGCEGVAYITRIEEVQGNVTEGINPRSQIDRLTGLPNRNLLWDRLEQSMLAARRSDVSVAIITVGIDRFSRINDGLGHAVGDQVLKEVANRLKKTIRSNDTVARLGGDLFALVMAVTAQDDAVIVAEKLLNITNAPIVVDGQELSVTVSVGISIYPSDGEDADTLLKGSDSALHHAKDIGKNCYQFFSNDMNSRAKQRIQLESDLRKALENDEFRVFYQPKVDIESDAIVGSEALIRWIHPERGMISPGEFIPVAEESGLIGPIGEWVLRKSCEENALWQSQGLKGVKVSVNMAVPQFRSRAIVQQVKDILNETGLRAEMLEIEITESMLMGRTEEVIAKLQAMRDIGISIAIDDFGTGYSSLNYLSRFPITTLKIDRAFVQDLESNQRQAEITRAIIGLSQGLELGVIAEGTENAQHIAFLKKHGCNTVQGFYYSRPVPSEEFEDMLRNGVISKPDSE